MRTSLKIAAVSVGMFSAAIASVAGAGVATASPASPNSVANCSQRNDFLKIVSSTNGTHCFANSGGNSVSYGGNISFTSGNNAGYLLYYQTAQACNPGQCAPPSRYNFGKNASKSFSFVGAGAGISYIYIN